jgi:signal transduction histidine kinase
VAATPLGGTDGNHGAIILLRDARAESEVERMREDFFNIASHELRTPLTVIKGNLEMAMEESPPPRLQATIQEALSSTGRLIRMVNDFLDAARLDHGAVSMRLEVGDLHALVRQAVETMRSDAERKGLTITYQAMSDLPLVRMDAERVLQILINLIGNSVRYTQAGQIEISHDVDGKDVETMVKDTGIGIPAEHHDRLFVRFGQVERGLRRGGGGSGLGLYISKRLAEQMGGTIVLKESAAGQGSTFTLRLPIAAPEPVAVR